jgi:hypothetical protein
MPPEGSDLVFDRRHDVADRVFRIAMTLVPPPAGAGRTRSVILDAETDR